MFKEENAWKEAANYATEEIIYERLFIEKKLSNKYDTKTFIVDYGATSHMVATEENVSNLCNVETIVTVWDSWIITGGGGGLLAWIPEMQQNNPLRDILWYVRNNRLTQKFI